MNNYTSAQIKDALNAIGIVHESETITKSDVLNYFNEINPETKEYKCSIPDIVIFLTCLGLDYKDFIDCNRNGLLEHFNKKVGIDGNLSSVGFFNLLKERISNYFAKPIEKLKFKVGDIPKKEEILSFYNDLLKFNRIEILNNSSPYQVSTDNKFFYISSIDGKVAVDVTSADKIWLQFFTKINTDLFILTDVTTDNKPGKLVGFGKFVEKEGKYYLELLRKNIFIDFSNNNRAYKIIFSNTSKIRWYAANLESVSHELPKDEDHVLCIDFGTSNTSVGTWSGYNEQPQLVEFDDMTDSNNLKSSYLLPSNVYIQHAILGENEKKYDLLFGYEAIRHLKDNNYEPKGSYFLSIKQWLSAKDDYEVECKDEDNQVFKLPVKYIIGEYLKNVICLAEIKFKKHFVKLHFSAPVKQKSRFNKLVSSIFTEDKGYEVISPSKSLDEGLAIIYNTISNLRVEFANNKNVSEERKVKPDGKIMIIDCGGGTTDIASCKYHFEEKDTGINANITTKFENGFDFGGNDLTYLIFQLLKIKLSDYYKTKNNTDSSTKFSIDNIFNRDSDSFLEEIDSCFEERKEFNYYKKLDELSNEAEWVLPTDFGNKKYVDGSNNISKARRNFAYLWNWAEKLKIKFFSSNKMASFFFTEEEEIKIDKKDKLMYFYVDEKGNKDCSKLNLNRKDNIPDIEINNKELAVLLSPQIYYTLSLAMPSPEQLKGIRIRLSGQSSKIGLFRELLKEFIRGKDTRGKINASSEANDKKLSCVKGCIQYFVDNEYGALNTTLEIESPNIPYLVNIDKGPNTTIETLFDGSYIKKSSEGCGLMLKIDVSKREFKEGIIRFEVSNKAYNTDKIQYKDSLKLNTDLKQSTKLNSLSELMKRIKDNSLTSIENYKIYEIKTDEDGEKYDDICQESVLERLEYDLKTISSDSNGKLLIFAVPNNDGCGFIIYQVAKFEDSGSMQYYLTAEDMLYYEKVEEFKSIFDGCNCK